MSVTMEPVFLHLAHEYRMLPSHRAALALYDVFCAPDAPARINARLALPPRNLRLAATINSIRLQCRQQASAAETGGPTVPPLRYLFDFVVETLINDPRGRIAQLRRRYNPSKSAIDNLPGGKMTEGQRAFVDRIWKPLVRPRLVTAGFWRIATIE